jgi:FixJ family two-component response regulator
VYLYPRGKMLGQMIDKAKEPIRIALIDDDASVRSAVSRLLRSHDYACKSYESAESALADPELGRADCMVLDIQLSGMDGFAMRDRLLQDGVLTPCLFITAHADTDSPEWKRAIGNNPCVIKPFDESQLLTTIHDLLDNRSHPPAP